MAGLSETAELDAFVEARRREDNLPGVSLAVVHGGRVLSRSWGVGVSGVGSVFHIGSLTKLVTAVTALRLRERGLLDLDAPVRRWFPFQIAPATKGAAPEITLRHLLTHRSGLPRGPYLTAPVPPEERLAALAGMRLAFPPGERYKYSNLGYALAAQALVRAAGRSWESLAGELLPAGGPAVPGHQRDHYRSLVRPGDVLRPPSPIAAPEGAGDLVASAEGLVRLLAALLGGEILSPASFTELATPQAPAQPGVPTYGLALRVGRRFGRRCLHHDGGHAGFHALLRVFPAEGLAGVVLSNRCSAHTPASEILDFCLGPLLGADPPEPEPLGRLTGGYAGLGRRIEICETGGRLALRHGGDEIPLRRFGPDRFRQEWGPFSEHLLRFNLDARGQGEPWECVTGPLRWTAEEEGLGPLLREGPFPPGSRRDERHRHLAGVYSHPAVGDVRIFLRQGRPCFSFYYGEEVPLRPVRGPRGGVYRIEGGLLDGELLSWHGEAIEAGGMRFVRRELRPEDLLVAL